MEGTKALLLAFAGLFAVVGSAFSIPSSSPPVGTTELLGEWDAMNFSGSGPCHSCMLAGVKVDSRGTVYVSVPRWQAGVPATLSVLDTSTGVLTPFPSAELNAVGSLDALQSVLGFEIDAHDRLWALDQGKVNGQAAVPGSIKLMVWDLRSNRQVFLYRFSAEEAPLNSSFLNDIVLDQLNNFAYITDSGIDIDASKPLQPALLAFDIVKQQARRVLDSDISVMNTDLWLVVNGSKVYTNTPMLTGADGIALTADTKTLFFCPLTSHTLYSIETEFLRNFDLPLAKLAALVKNVTDKGSASDGLGASNNGLIYLTSLEENAVHMFNSSEHVVSTLTTDHKMIWPDTLGFDHQGWLVFVTNNLPKYAQKTIDYSVPNFRLWRTFINADSYLFPRHH